MYNTTGKSLLWFGHNCAYSTTTIIYLLVQIGPASEIYNVCFDLKFWSWRGWLQWFLYANWCQEMCCHYYLYIKRLFEHFIRILGCSWMWVSIICWKLSVLWWLGIHLYLWMDEKSSYCCNNWSHNFQRCNVKWLFIHDEYV